MRTRPRSSCQVSQTRVVKGHPRPVSFDDTLPHAPMPLNPAAPRPPALATAAPPNTVISRILSTPRGFKTGGYLRRLRDIVNTNQHKDHQSRSHPPRSTLSQDLTDAAASSRGSGESISTHNNLHGNPIQQLTFVSMISRGLYRTTPTTEMQPSRRAYLQITNIYILSNETFEHSGFGV